MDFIDEWEFEYMHDHDDVNDDNYDDYDDCDDEYYYDDDMNGEYE